jgi:penicillin-binding protein 2
VVGYAQDTTYDAENIPEHLRDHALFIGFAPARAPKIAIAVMIENGGSGGGTASPIGGLVVDFWQRKTGQYE